MATRILDLGNEYVFDANLYRWKSTTDPEGAKIFTSALPADGPPGSTPNVGEWAIEQLAKLAPTLEVLEVDATPHREGVIY